MSTSVTITIVVLFVKLALVSPAKILAVFPTPSISHQIVFRPLIHELVSRGHEVTVITTDPVFPKGKAPSNLIEIDLHDVSYNMWSDLFMKENNRSEDDHYSQIYSVLRILSKIFEVQLVSSEVQEIINNKRGQYDLVLVEAFVKFTLAFTHIFKVPTIQISSFGGALYNLEAVGASTHPLLYLPITSQRIYNLSNYEKLQQLYYRWQVEISYDIIEEEDNKMLKKLFGQNFPSLRELSYNVDMLFLNTHPIWTDNQPVPSNVVYIGGIHTHSVKELPKDIDLLLNASINGVIYFSLGTNVNTTNLLQSKIKMMMKVFSQLPYDVIWKWDEDSMPGKAENIKLFKWVPQPDLLKHRNIKLFITQGGLQSTDEAIDAGVPVIGIPILVDQWYNTEKYLHHKIGMRLNLPDLTEKEFRDAIETVISDESYRENIIKLRTLMRDEPQTPLQRAVWWTEYVLRHGGAKHLRAAGANITWAQYLELELVLLVIVFFSIALIIIFLILYLLRILITKDYWPNTKIKIS